MIRLALGVAAAMLAMTACSGTAAPTVPVIASGAVPTGLASAALTQLCTASGAGSLATIEGNLDSVGSTTDTSAVEAQLATLLTNLQQLQASGATTAARDAAVTSVQQLQTSIKDPATRQDAAKKAADALRAVGSALCK
jgi:hypothetical protein